MACIFLATACGSGQMEGQDESVVETIEKIQIEVAHDGDVDYDAALLKIADGFNSSQDLYEVTVRTNNSQDNNETSARMSGSKEQNEESVSAGSSQGQYTVPITSSVFFTSDDTAASYELDTEKMDLTHYLGSESGKDSLYSIIESLPVHMYETVCNEERGIFYLPVSVIPPIFFYNKTVYDGLGLSLPKSYSELRDNCLSIYSRYRTPGYLPYDLEGDIVAMMREQDAILSRAGEEGNAESTATELEQNGSDATSATAEAGQVTKDQVTAGQAAAGQSTDSTASTSTEVNSAMTKGEVLQFFAGSCEAGYFRMVKHEAYPVKDFSTGAVASFAGTPADREMATTDVTFEVGMLPWVMDQEDSVYWVDTSGMLFLDRGDEKNAGAVAFAAYLLRSDVCAEYLESVGGISPYASVYESQAYRKNRRGFDELTKAAEEKMSQADFIMLSNDKRRELDELLLYILDKKVTADDAVKIFEMQPSSRS